MLDVPGFGDTRGVDQDVKNADLIVNSLKDLNYINAVMLITKGTQSRSTAMFEYVLARLASVLPGKVSDHIVLMLTFCKRKYDVSKSFPKESFKHLLGIENFRNRLFTVENPFCWYQNYIKYGSAVSADLTDVAKLYEDAKKTSIDKMWHSMVLNFDSLPTRHFVELQMARLHLEGALTSILQALRKWLDKSKRLEGIKEEVAAAQASKEGLAPFVNHIQKVKAARFKDVGESTKTTLCRGENGKGDCHCNCHENCRLDFCDGGLAISGCLCFGGAERAMYCKKCKHDRFQHYHAHKKWILVTEVEPLVNESAKRELEKASSVFEKKKILLKEINEQISEIGDRIEAKVAELPGLTSTYESLGMVRSFEAFLQAQQNFFKHVIENQDSTPRILSSLQDGQFQVPSSAPSPIACFISSATSPP